MEIDNLNSGEEPETGDLDNARSDFSDREVALGVMYARETLFEHLLEEYGDIENVPNIN